MKTFKIFGCILALTSLFTGCSTDDVEPLSGDQIKVTLTAAPASISEENGTSQIIATLSSPASENVEVGVIYLGNATLGTDFSASEMITIPAGSLSGSIPLASIQDTIKEGNETITVEIISIVGASENGKQSLNITIEDDDVPFQINIIVNEILYDPSNSGLDGDANGDGKYAQNEDEFIEFINMSTKEVDLSGYQIFDTENLAINTPNHVISDGTILQPGKALVIFGGGTPTGSFGNAIVQTSTSGDLNLNNAGDEMTLKDADGNIVVTMDIEPLSNNPNESYSRNPDLTGDFEQHSKINTFLFSPGTKIDGTPF